MSASGGGFGEVSSVDLRQLWPHEERDFTPWLLENSVLLERALGIDIELHHREERIGDFSLDIIGRDLSSDAPLIIENQLEPSDHRHLGQLLTYASGSDAGTIVWIARSFSEPHRSALDWLNTHTSDGIRFFGIEIRAIRVDDSRPAPVLEVVARPNDWERRVASSTKPLSPKMELYREFWDRYLTVALAGVDDGTHAAGAVLDRATIRALRSAHQRGLREAGTRERDLLRCRGCGTQPESLRESAVAAVGLREQLRRSA